MTERDLVNLLIAYDGYQELKEALVGNVGFGFAECIFGKLERIEEVICAHTELDVDSRIDVLDDKDATVEERARRLLGSVHSESA